MTATSVGDRRGGCLRCHEFERRCPGIAILRIIDKASLRNQRAFEATLWKIVSESKTCAVAYVPSKRRGRECIEGIGDGDLCLDFSPLDVIAVVVKCVGV